jgi:glycosyltransferase involved in cell wall biosynthesis
MRVVIDATVVTPRQKGTGRVVQNLVAALPTAAPHLEFVALTFPDGVSLLPPSEKNLVVRQVEQRRNVAWELHGLAREATAVEAGAVFTLREFVGFGGPPTLMHVAEPPSYRLQRGVARRSARSVAKDAFLQMMLRGSVKRAASVTAASETTASWLRDRYGIDPPVIPPGIDPFFLAPTEPGNHGTRYFLHAASGDNRDNSELVFTSFAGSQLADDGIGLVLVGTPSVEQARLRGIASRLGIEDSVSFTGWVTDARLRELYRDAIALVQPSRYEGFAGLQPLEAMAQGTPVIASHAPGVTEELGSAAELVPPDRPDLLTTALVNVATNEVLRSRLGQAGRAKAQDLTWERAAAKFVEALDRMC